MANQVSNVLSNARTFANTDSNGISDATGIAYMNDALLELQLKMIKQKEDLFLQESRRDILAAEITGGSSPGRFLFPNDMWFLKTIEANLQDTTNSSLYITCSPIDIANTPNDASFDWLRSNQNINSPIVAIHGDWFELFPTPTQTMASGVKINYYLQPTQYVLTTDYVVYPFNINIDMIAYKVSAMYARSHKDFDLAKEFEQKSDDNFENFMYMLSGQQSQQPLRSKPLALTGYEF
ncbi:MAG: hypothetical protein KGN01_07160 [Patescibacteria group bacterium]|nr:hypothetical protein [Patescibacteria group bacterium]